MSVNVFEHPWLSGLFGDDEMDRIWSAQAQLRHMIAFEAAWSRGLGAIGLADRAVAETAAKKIEATEIDIDALNLGTAKDGVVVPALVKQLKSAVGEEAVHKGATSQDVIDTATALILVQSFDLLEARLAESSKALETLEARFGANTMMGRTRMQAALPITVADRVQAWRLPLREHLQRLTEIRPRISVLQLGGAAGDRAALGEHAQAMTDFVAKELGLRSSPRSWHTRRDGIADAAHLFALISGTLGKMGQDIALMAQQGIDEVTLAGAGGSSAMPHKQNPILAELLVTLARFNATQIAGMQHALVHEQERSGTAWMLEWMILPQMAITTARSLSASAHLLSNVTSLGSKSEEME